MKKIGIIGGAGYTGGELIRLALQHPNMELVFVHSQSHAGQELWKAHPDLLGETDLQFTSHFSTDIDLLFSCAGHGKTAPFLQKHPLPVHVKVIDLSRDFRLQSPEHDYVYGLPELNRAHIVKAQFIANPGCFATCIQLGLLPMAKSGLLKSDIHIHAITGSTGAGQNPQPTTHFSWRNNNISIYKAFNHQHLDEINQSICQLQPEFDAQVNFLPIRGDFTRGIYASMYLNTPFSEAACIALYEDYYAQHPFVHISPKNPNLKQVVNTNKAIIHLQKHQNKLLIISMIDNLLKGASGQAVQNFNLMFGLPENQGLSLKAMAF